MTLTELDQLCVQSVSFLNANPLTAGTTAKTRTKRRMRMSPKKRNLRKKKMMRKRMTTRQWATAVSICSSYFVGKIQSLRSELVLGNCKNADRDFGPRPLPVSIVWFVKHH